MRVIWCQSWENISYGKGLLYDWVSHGEPFCYWSDLVLGEGDKTLKPSRSAMLGPINWLIKHFTWKRYIVLLPTLPSTVEHKENIRFRVGFYDKMSDICKVSTAIRYVRDGPFAMRIGPTDCCFFIVAEEKVTLSHGGYFYKDMDLY